MDIVKNIIKNRVNSMAYSYLGKIEALRYLQDNKLASNPDMTKGKIIAYGHAINDLSDLLKIIDNIF